MVYDSALEMRFFRDFLQPKIVTGEILSVERQIKYELQKKFNHNGKTVLPINYVADFVVQYKDGHTTVFDTKGNPDSIALLKRKLFWFVYPDIDYQWITYSKIDSNGTDGGWVQYETVKQGRKERKKAKQSNNN